MRTNLDVSPFYGATVGFDRVFDLLDNAARVQSIGHWPPYDIVRTGEDSYRIEMAVAGFTQDELSITAEPNLLVVTGEKKVENSGDYLHRGIAKRPFARRFDLADHVHVTAAHLTNGLLTIELRREIPEAMKPRRIAIGATSALEHKLAA